MIRYLSICSGIEAFSVAVDGLGFVPAAFSEIDPFASAVLAHRFGANLPGEPPSRNAPPNLGDFTRLLTDADIRADLGQVDLLVGGTPCQAFSFAGKRLSLDDARGNLTLAFAVLAHELARSHGCRNALWENVLGVLSTPDNAFGCFLGALVGHDRAIPAPRGRKWPDAGLVSGPRARAAWRVLDAQYFGLAQRRERVFVVIDLGGGADPAAVLFEPQGLRGNSPPRREAGQKPAPTIAGGARSRGGYSHDDTPLVGGAYGGGNRSGAIDVAATLTAKGQRIDFEVETFIAEIAGTLPAGANSTGGERQPGMGAETAAAGYLIAFDTTQITSATNRSSPQPGAPCHPLGAANPTAIAFSCKDHGADASSEIAPTRRAMGHGESHPNAGGQVAVAAGWGVRRLIVDECARLLGFPDGWTRIPWRGKPAELCPDGPQYKGYGNSMAVAVMRWIAERLAAEMARAAA